MEQLLCAILGIGSEDELPLYSISDCGAIVWSVWQIVC
jgi:hypothetical protein